MKLDTCEKIAREHGKTYGQMSALLRDRGIAWDQHSKLFGGGV